MKKKERRKRRKRFEDISGGRVAILQEQHQQALREVLAAEQLVKEHEKRAAELWGAIQEHQRIARTLKAE